MSRGAQAVAALHASTERNPFACALSAVLVYEVVSDPRAASLLYPVNQLRNTARLQVRVGGVWAAWHKCEGGG